MKPKLVTHTKISGEIFLSIFNKNQKIGEIPLGTAPKAAREKAKEFLDAVKACDDISDEIS